MLTILHIDNSIDVTGAYKALFSWCTLNPQHRHIWILPSGSMQIEETKREFLTYEFEMAKLGKSTGRIFRYLPNQLRNAKRLNKIIDEEKVDVVHMNDFYVIFPYLISNRRRVEFWVHARLLRKSYPAYVYNFFIKLHLKLATKIIAVSRAVKKDWGNLTKVDVVYDPIYLEERLPKYEISAEGKENFRFLYLANYIRGKGQDDALLATQKLLQRGCKNFIVDFFGSAMSLTKNEEYLKNLKSQAFELGISQHVRFFPKEVDVEKRYKDYDAVLHFSKAESFCMVVYEALYYRLPTISTDCGGPDEMIIDGETGLLVPVGDIEEMANAMVRLMTNKNLLAKLSKNSGEFMRKFFPSNKNFLDEEIITISRNLREGRFKNT